MPLRAYEEINFFYRALPTYNPIKEIKGAPYTRTCEIDQTNYGKYKKNTTISLNGERYPTDVISFPVAPNSSNKLHPTQKPVELLDYLIRTYSNEGDLVLDPTMGVGSTGVAAVMLNRRFIGCEINEKYFGHAEKRIKSAHSLLISML